MPRKRERGPRVVALGGVVVDDVEQDLDAGAVQRLHHRLELAHLLAAVARREARVRSEEAERVVAPVVAETAPRERLFADAVMHRQQLDAR